MRHRFLPFLFALLAACSGNIGDLFSAFPASAFAPDDGEGDGDQPGVPGAFDPVETGFLAAAQGVTGDVRNIAVATVGSERIAFLSAGPDGVHMVDVTTPDIITPAAYLATVDDTVLNGSPAAIAGGRVDDVAVVDNAYLVCVAVGSGAPNAVTIFHIPTLLDRATTSPADLSDAYVPGTGNIPAPGTPQGNGGGASGGGNVFLVATGGAELGTGLITPGTPGTWAALPPLTSNDPQIDNFIDVDLALPTAAYAVVAEGDTLRLATFTIQLLPTPGVVPVGDLLPLTGSFSALDGNASAFPGTYPSTLARDPTGTMYVSGQNDIRVFSVATPTAPTETNTIFSAGFEIAGLAASVGFVARTNSADMTVYTTLAGTPTPVASFEVAGRRNLGISLASGAAGRFALVCANNNGLRVVQWSDIP